MVRIDCSSNDPIVVLASPCPFRLNFDHNMLDMLVKVHVGQTASQHGLNGQE